MTHLSLLIHHLPFITNNEVNGTVQLINLHQQYLKDYACSSRPFITVAQPTGKTFTPKNSIKDGTLN
jgi:hypothetical protein